MIEALEVKSIEDSRVMDASLSSTSTEGVQSTSRSWKRRLLLAVAPIFGIALATGAIYNQVTAKPTDVVVPATGGNPALAGKGPEALKRRGSAADGASVATKRRRREKETFRKILTRSASGKLKERTELAAKKLALIQTNFRQVLTDNAARFALKGGIKYLPLRETSMVHPKEPICAENDFKELYIPRFTVGPDSALGLKLKEEFQYNPSSHFEPSSWGQPRAKWGQDGSCRCWSYYQPKFFAKQGNASTDPVQVVAALWLMSVPTKYRDEFEDLYLKARPGALMVTDPVEKRFPDVVGIGRPAVRARSLYDLPWELISGGRFYVHLVEIVHSALSQLPSFYEATGFKVHGGINAHTLEVVMDEDLPVMAYVADYARSVAAHLDSKHNREEVPTPWPVPGPQTWATWDTFSGGVAMANSVAQYVAWYHGEEILADAFKPYDVRFALKIPEEKEYNRIRSKAMVLCDRADCPDSFRAVLRNMLTNGLWTIPAALGKLESLIFALRE